MDECRRFRSVFTSPFTAGKTCNGPVMRLVGERYTGRYGTVCNHDYESTENIGSLSMHCPESMVEICEVHLHDPCSETIHVTEGDVMSV